MPKVQVKYVREDVDRHGNIRVYYRPPKGSNARQVRLRGPKGSPEFWEDYHAAVRGDLKPVETKKAHTPDSKSLRYLCHKYTTSAAFTQLHPSTQRDRRQTLDRQCDMEGWGDKPFAALLPKYIRIRRDEMAETPAAANNMVKTFRQVFKYAVEYDLVDRNPAKEVNLLKRHSDGVHAWTLDEVAQYEATHPIGTTARLALALALYTGQRRSDIIQLGRQHIQDGFLVFTQTKNKHRKPIRLQIPIMPELQSIIDASPTGDLTFLVSDQGKAFTANGFGNRFRKWCNAAGLPNHCTCHGLRKTTASRLAELGRTPHEIMAITGHETFTEVIRYTQSANQRTRAQSAFEGFRYG